MQQKVIVIFVNRSLLLGELPSGPLSTKTVLGFLDFVTTVSDTVIKFTSQGGNHNHG